MTLRMEDPELPATLPRLPPPATLTARPTTQACTAIVNASRASTAGQGTGCAVCSRLPALAIPVRRQVGLIVLRRTIRTNSALCREHGVQQAQTFLLRTLIQGWWGIISFFVNFIAIATDLAALSQYRRLGTPEGTERRNPSASALRAPFGSKRRLLTLIWVVLGIVIIGALVGFIGAAVR